MIINPMVEGKDYVVIQKFLPHGEEWHIEIKTGKFAKTIFAYEKLAFIADFLHFEYRIISSPFSNLKEENTDFYGVVKEILIDLFQKIVTIQKEKGAI